MGQAQRRSEGTQTLTGLMAEEGTALLEAPQGFPDTYNKIATPTFPTPISRHPNPGTLPLAVFELSSHTPAPGPSTCCSLGPPSTGSF